MLINAAGQTFEHGLKSRSLEGAVKEVERRVEEILKAELKAKGSAAYSYIVEPWDVLMAHAILASMGDHDQPVDSVEAL